MRVLFSLLAALAAAAAPPVPTPPALGRPALSPGGFAPLRLVIMGPPASGKGTLSQRVAEDFGVVHVSAGDLLRERAAADPALAETMKRGELVPVELVSGLVRERLERPDARERGFILDGFPRRLAEAWALSDMLAEQGVRLDAAISVEVPRRELLRRMRERGRPDDTEETFRRRLRTYRRETKPAMRLVARETAVLRPPWRGLDKDSNYLALKGLLEAFLESAAPSKK